MLRAAGFRNISMDLIAGLPHQTRESWEAIRQQLLRLFPSTFRSTCSKSTKAAASAGKSLAGGSRYSASAIPDDDAMAEFYESACARLAAAGYEHYEISNWGLPGRHRSTT